MTENEPQSTDAPIDPTSTEAKAAEARRIAEAYIQSAMAKKAAEAAAADEAAQATAAVNMEAAAEALSGASAMTDEQAAIAADVELSAAQVALEDAPAIPLEATPVAGATETFGAVLEAESLPPQQPTVPNAVAAAAFPATAAMPPQAAAPAPAQPVAEEPKKKGKGKIIALIIVIILLLAALAGAGIFFFLNGSSETPTAAEDATELPRMSDAQVIAAFDDASMEAPDISKFAYVSQDALIGPQFSDIVLNEVTGTNSGQPIECDATATATFKNKGVEIVVPVTLPFTYDPVSNAWVPGELTRGEAVGTPLASPSATEILANLNTILSAYDPTYAEQMGDAEITKTNANLTIDGGIIGVDLSKSVTTEADGVKRTTLSTSSVTLAVAWSSTEGWVVSVNNAGDISSTPTETIAQNQGQAVEKPNDTAAIEPAPQPSVEPDKVGKANYGDSLVLAGTLQRVEDTARLASNNNYSNSDASANADGAVQFVLVLKRPLEITLGDKSYTLASVAIATNGLSSSDLNTLYGKTATVSGSIEESFGTSWTPVGLKTLEIRDVAA